jgi:hypothetical protein
VEKQGHNEPRTILPSKTNLPERGKKVGLMVFLVQIEGAGLPIREEGVEKFGFGFEEASLVVKSFHRVFKFLISLYNRGSDKGCPGGKEF